MSAAFAPHEALAGKDARTLAREILQMTQEEFSRAFQNSPMKRAKRRGLKRNAAVVLGKAEAETGFRDGVRHEGNGHRGEATNLTTDRLQDPGDPAS